MLRAQLKAKGMFVEIQPKAGMVVHACHFSPEKMKQEGYEFQATLGSIVMLLKERE